VLFVLNAALNFAIFLWAYKKLAFPFLHEEQRMENAPVIFFYVVPGFMLVSFCVFLVVYWFESRGLCKKL
jgi:hypothetical protein